MSWLSKAHNANEMGPIGDWHKKVRGVAVADDPGYAGWILRNNFPQQTKMVLEKLLAELQNIVNIDMTEMRKEWHDDADRQFRLWAQNRARAAIAKATV